MRILSAWIPVLLVELLVLYLSSRPNLHLTSVVPHLDKPAHFVEYAVVGGVLYRALRMTGAGRSFALGWTALLVAGLGGLDEWFQAHVPGRDSGVGDWSADLLGGLAGAWAARWLEGRLPERIWDLGMGRRKAPRSDGEEVQA